MAGKSWRIQLFFLFFCSHSNVLGGSQEPISLLLKYGTILQKSSNLPWCDNDNRFDKLFKVTAGGRLFFEANRDQTTADWFFTLLIINKKIKLKEKKLMKSGSYLQIVTWITMTRQDNVKWTPFQRPFKEPWHYQGGWNMQQQQLCLPL